jgi:hypothetical protein
MLIDSKVQSGWNKYLKQVEFIRSIKHVIQLSTPQDIGVGMFCGIWIKFNNINIIYLETTRILLNE